MRRGCSHSPVLAPSGGAASPHPPRGRLRTAGRYGSETRALSQRVSILRPAVLSSPCLRLAASLPGAAVSGGRGRRLGTGTARSHPLSCSHTRAHTLARLGVHPPLSHALSLTHSHALVHMHIHTCVHTHTHMLIHTHDLIHTHAQPLMLSHTLVCSRTPTFICSHALTLLCSHTLRHTCTPSVICSHTCTHSGTPSRSHTHLLSCTHIHTHALACTHTHLSYAHMLSHLCIHTCSHTCSYTLMWSHASAYIHSHMLTHSRICVHICACACAPPRAVSQVPCLEGDVFGYFPGALDRHAAFGSEHRVQVS